ncbi:MAG: hypothetical protein U1F46_14145 [Marinagarivorans sp.]
MRKLMLMLLVSSLLAACRSGGERAYYDDGYGYTRGGFSFNSFDLIDTYDIDTRRSSSTPSIDSLNTDGKFSAFWRIDTQQNYEAFFFINTAPVESGNRTIGYAYCGGSDVRTCYLSEGSFYCGMSNSGSISCEDGRGNAYIGDLLRTTNRYYLGLKICSTQGYGCTTKYREVTVY